MVSGRHRTGREAVVSWAKPWAMRGTETEGWAHRTELLLLRWAVDGTVGARTVAYESVEGRCLRVVPHCRGWSSSHGRTGEWGVGQHAC